MKQNIEEIFEKVTGNKPYSFQIQVGEKIASGKNVILQAPTGSGKTWGAIIPFIACWGQDNFSQKLIYSLPLRTLANSLYKETKENKIIQEMKLNITLQTGEHSDDELFTEGDITFTTIDQTLSAILAIPLSLPKKLYNINAGAVISSYLVFDEFHLLDPKRSLNTTLTILRKLKKITHFCLMTATLSTRFVSSIAEFLDAEIIKVNEKDYKHFAFVKNNAHKQIYLTKSTIDSDKVIKEHNKKSIVLCNTIDQCKKIYLEIKEKLCNRKDIEIICIHSQFFAKDRESKEKKIIENLGKNATDQSIILVSTQVIEAGIDISCENLHSELAPINSLLQRMGRCARWGGTGKVFLYDLKDGKNNHLPYSKKLVEKTQLVLPQFEGMNIDLTIAQEMIDLIIQEWELEIFHNIEGDDTFDVMKKSWLFGEKNKIYSSLVRDILSVSVVLLPENTVTRSLFAYESINIHPQSLIAKLKKYDLHYQDKGEIPNLVFILEEENNIEDEYQEKRILSPLSNYDEIRYQNVVALNSDYFGYSNDIGLLFDKQNSYTSKAIRKNTELHQYAIEIDTYEQHIVAMIRVYEKKLQRKSIYTIRKLQKVLQIDQDLEQLVYFMIILHDYGKLNVIWQNIVNDYQRLKWQEKKQLWQNDLLAHTDYDPNTNPKDKDYIEQAYKKNNENKKPPHAGIGAYVTLCCLPAILLKEGMKKKTVEKITYVVSMAILRHHSTFSKSFQAYKIVPNGLECTVGLLKEYIPDYSCLEGNCLDKVKDGDKIDECFNDFISFPSYAALYFVFVRILRLCDQLSFEEVKEMKNENLG